MRARRVDRKPAARIVAVSALAAGLTLSIPCMAAGAETPSPPGQAWEVRCTEASATDPGHCVAVSEACTGSQEPLQLIASRADGPNASGETMLFIKGPRQVYTRAVLQVDKKPEHVLTSPACSFGYCMVFEPRGGFVDQMKWATTLAVRIERVGAAPIVASCPLSGFADALSRASSAAPAQ